jgi:multidrug efflux pump subunit AcrB
MASLIALLVINTSLNQDAFVLQRLKQQMNVVNDQRDAILRAQAEKSSPISLSAAAIKLGMTPSTTPSFIELSGSQK